MKDKLRKIIREEVSKQMDEMLKSDIATVEKIKNELIKKYGDDPELVYKIKEFITLEKVDPGFTVKSLLDRLKIYLNVELS
jgi:hypothetical protein